MILVAIYTVGRRDYLEQTLASFREQVRGPVSRIVAFDDSGDPDFRAWLETLGISVASWGWNRGYSSSVARSWVWIDGHAVEPYVFHLEEDFLFDRPIELEELVRILEGDSELDQVALLRGAWYPSERRAGGIVEKDPEGYERRSIEELEYLVHDKIFTTNPCLYRRELCRVGWPDEPRSERLFTISRRDRGRRFAYFGNGAPQISHIGAERVGHGY